MKKIISNAFSIQMLPVGSHTVKFDVVSEKTVKEDLSTGEFLSAVGHADTAAVLSDTLGLSIETNRISISLDNDTELYVAQLTGGRLPEGSTTLPEGFKFKFYRVTLS